MYILNTSALLGPNIIYTLNTSPLFNARACITFITWLKARPFCFSYAISGLSPDIRQACNKEENSCSINTKFTT